ncbi:MAG TPA: hypothetical protein VFI06_07350 [Chitinophagaceae bacterium]|nr:hypothetical protein [Chitinophagaceae bacterium]
MKRPVAILSILFVCIAFSSVIVSTSIAGLCRSFYKNDGKSENVKTTPAQQKSNEDYKQASVKL